MHGSPNESPHSIEEASPRIQEDDAEQEMPCLDRFFFSGHHLMRFAQVAGFVVSYVISREAFEPPEWQEHFELALAVTLSLCVIYIVLCTWFYYHAPLFLGLMSLPPRVTKYSEKSMWDLLAHGVKDQVMERYMKEHAEVVPAILRTSHLYTSATE